jgi:hypothetical protein
MSDYNEVVKGRIVSREGSAPVAGAEVEVYDKDMLIDDYLGKATTDRDGRFKVDFTWADFKDDPFEDRPDIYLKVRNPATGKTTKSKVFEELSGELAADDSEEVMDLGDVPVD